MLLLTSVPYGEGWNPINHMIGLAAEAFGATVVDARQLPPPTLLQRSREALAGRRRAPATGDRCLLIGAAPTDLLRIFSIPGWRDRFSSIAAWIIDSYWTDWIPRAVRIIQPFDHLFITSGEDCDGWERVLGRRPAWLPWGTDALGLGSAARQRDIDLTRLGRQPPDWDDDAETAARAAAAGLRFQPRPEAVAGFPVEDHHRVSAILGRTKYVLAFSNLAHRSAYTHPTRAHLTGRWVDSLGAGACVAGIAPRGACVDSLLWPGATLELGSTDRAEGLRMIAAAKAAWTPAAAERNHTLALRRLDWRWRFEALASAFATNFAPLDRQLGELRNRIDAVGSVAEVEPAAASPGFPA